MGSIGLPTSHHLYPPFPDNVETAPLVSISLAKLQAGDENESAAFYKASKDLGFFYLELGGSALGEQLVEESERLNSLMIEFYKRPVEEREEFAREKVDTFFGYRQTKLRETYPDGRPKLHEIYNMRKDDFVRNTDPLPCHELVKKHWNLFQSYVLHCRAAIDLMITHLENHLQLPRGTLAELHRMDQRSGDHVRFIQAAPVEFSEERAAIGEHTDFGTLTFLMNWLGGLQIRRPDTEKDWIYVKPVPGSAVVNLGDALVKFTAGILRSNVHRVVPAPGAQTGLERQSLVYFSRPEDKVILKRLKGGLIDAQPQGDDGPEMTAEEWTWKRSVGDMQGVYTHKGGLEQREGYKPKVDV